MTAAPTIAEFLLARIDEDETRARLDEPHWPGCRTFDHLDEGGLPCSCDLPGRLLVECEAKRRIVAEHADLNATWHSTDLDLDVLAVCTTCEDRRRHDAAAWPCTTLRALAEPYAGHDDYRKEWRLPLPARPTRMTP